MTLRCGRNRALDWPAQVPPARWCVRGGGFKGEPVARRVQIGCSVAESCRRQGAATAAVGRLLALAFEAGVDEVLAEVREDNFASVGGVRKLGFEARRTRIDIDNGNDTLWQWVAIAPCASPLTQEPP